MLRMLESALSRFASGSPRRNAGRAAVARASDYTLQNLEDRRLLSVTFSNGVLDVVGTAGNDNIVVSLLKTDKSKITVTGAGVAGDYAVDSVNLINIQGLGGSDRLNVDQGNGRITVNAWISGGRGADTIQGAQGVNTLYGGRGPDLLVGAGSADSIVGGRGDDKIIGSTTNGGSDTIDAGMGLNLISDNNSGNSIINTSVGTNTINTGKAALLATNTLTAELTANLQNNAVIGYTPRQIRVAYGLGDLTNGAYTNRGQGETIAIVDAYDDPTAQADLAFFSQTFSLPAPTADTFQKIYQGGTQPLTNGGWAQEISLDIEWAHAIAPLAKIVLVEAQSATTVDLLAASRLAAQYIQGQPGGGGVVSMSFGGAEATTDTTDDFTYNDPAYAATTSFIAASGDTAGEVSSPAESPFVTSVGGTTLPLNADGTRIAAQPESAWASGGGGISAVQPQPGYQTGVTVGGVAYATRIGPDVAMDADPATGVAVYDSTPDDNGNTGWQQIGGTSLSCPMFAGIVTLANQVRTSNGLKTIGINLNNAIYAIAKANQSGNFNDITIGSNANPGPPNGGPALPGFDLATGWGSVKSAPFIIAIASQDIGTFPNINFVNTTLDFSAVYTNNSTTATQPVFQPQFANFQGVGTALGFNNVALAFSVPGTDAFSQQNGTFTSFTVNSVTVNTTDNTFVGEGTFVFTFTPTGTAYSLPVLLTGRISNGKIKGNFVNYALIQYGNGVYIPTQIGTTNSTSGLLEGSFSS